MKKRVLALMLAGAMGLSLTACGANVTPEQQAQIEQAINEAATEIQNAVDEAQADAAATTDASTGATTDVAFVTDVGNIDDHSFNQ